MRFIVVGRVVSCLFLPFTMHWFSTLRRHLCGARWTLVWSVSRSSVEQTGHKCGVNACFNQLFRLLFSPVFLFSLFVFECIKCGNFFFPHYLLPVLHTHGFLQTHATRSYVRFGTHCLQILYRIAPIYPM